MAYKTKKSSKEKSHLQEIIHTPIYHVSSFDFHTPLKPSARNTLKYLRHKSKCITTRFGDRIKMNNIRPRKLNNVTSNLPSWGNTNYNNVASYGNEYSSYNNVAVKTIGNLNLKKERKSGKNKKKLVSKNSFEIDEKNIVEYSSINKDEDVSCFSVNGCKKNVSYYLQKTTLHGLRYIGDGHLSLLERVFWFAAVFAAVITAAYFINNIYVRWDMAPMIVSLNPEQSQITTVPFPAITVCNMNQARKSVADRINREGDFVDKKLLEGLCSVNNESANLDIDASIKAGEWSYYKRFLINVTQPCSQLLAACRWKGDPRACETLFNAALTDEGLCCTFNSVHREMMFRNPRDLSDLNITFPFPAVDWTPEAGYASDSPLEGFPWRPIGAGANLGLTLILDAAISEYFCSSTSSVGFKLLLHSPTETPKIADFGDLIAPGQEIRIIARPRIYDAQFQLRNIALNKRRCYFSEERELVYYRTYTQKNCVMECEARLTIERCNCSQSYMPKNSSVRICGMADLKCYLELKVAIEDKLNVNESVILVNTNCDDCFPACFELSYGRDVSQAVLKDSFQLREENLAGKTPEYFKENIAIVHIYFADTSFIRFTKGELFGFTDFLSNTGGLLGLFLGFSFLSLVEILYFLSLRMICAFYRHINVKAGTVYPFSQ